MRFGHRSIAKAQRNWTKRKPREVPEKTPAQGPSFTAGDGAFSQRNTQDTFVTLEQRKRLLRHGGLHSRVCVGAQSALKTKGAFSKAWGYAFGSGNPVAACPLEMHTKVRLEATARTDAVHVF